MKDVIEETVVTNYKNESVTNKGTELVTNKGNELVTKIPVDVGAFGVLREQIDKVFESNGIDIQIENIQERVSLRALRVLRFAIGHELPQKGTLHIF